MLHIVACNLGIGTAFSTRIMKGVVDNKIYFVCPPDLIQVPVDPLPEDRARRTLDRIDLLNKIREEIIQNEKMEERLKLCLPSLDMPEWWIPGKHDRDLLLGAARHGLGRTELFYVNDPELSFREILRRHMAGEPLVRK